jgi:hypothetical protein
MNLMISAKQGWIAYHRPRNPTWSASELIERANLYASEYLLRGVSNDFGELVGGLVPLKQSEVKSMKLEAVLERGMLLVSE